MKKEIVTLEFTELCELIDSVLRYAEQELQRPLDPYVNAQEAMRLLGVKKSKLADLRNSGEIHYSLVTPKNLMYSRESINMLLERNMQ